MQCDDRNDGTNEWACYEAGAEVYASGGEDDPIWRQRQRGKIARLLRGPLVADIGCGPGFDLAGFAALGLQTVGVDGSAAMLRIAARNSPSSVLVNQDLRLPLGRQVDGLWSMFALLHLPDSELATCFSAWRPSLADGGPLVIGLTESDVVPMREVTGWLGQARPCVFYYHRSRRVQELLSAAGYSIVSAELDTPECYRGGVYEELKMRAYVISARAD